MLFILVEIATLNQLLDGVVDHFAGGTDVCGDIPLRERRHALHGAIGYAAFFQHVDYSVAHVDQGQAFDHARRTAQSTEQFDQQAYGQVRMVMDDGVELCFLDDQAFDGGDGLYRCRARAAVQEQFAEDFARPQRVVSDFSSLAVVGIDSYLAGEQNIQAIRRIPLAEQDFASLVASDTAVARERFQRDLEVLRGRHWGLEESCGVAKSTALARDRCEGRAGMIGRFTRLGKPNAAKIRLFS